MTSRNLAYPSPLAQLLGLWDGEQADVVLRAERLHQLLVVWLVAVLSKHTQLTLHSVRSSITVLSGEMQKGSNITTRACCVGLMAGWVLASSG